MNIKGVLKELDLSPTDEELSQLKSKTKTVIGLLTEEIKKSKTKAEVFVGGSYVKGTLTRSKKYDIDIFVRFDSSNEDISPVLENIAKKVSSKLDLPLTVLHGSRDYFRLMDKLTTFELIPVVKIKKPVEAKNVTDLSYFHVNYVKKKLNKNIAREIMIAKTFCHGQGVYGAESYIKGFSGYALECLLIYYKTFDKFLNEMIKVNDRLVIDIEKKYKKKDDVLFELNEGKIHGPLIVIDPTWKERNVTSSLSRETFHKFQDSARNFLKKPSKEFFIPKEIDSEQLKKLAAQKKAELVHITLKTNKQEGDIAGTKMKKFSNFLIKELTPYFDVIHNEFWYNDKQESDFYLILKSKGEIIKIGPPVKMKDFVINFKKQNKDTFEKNGIVHARVKITNSAIKFLNEWISNNRKKIEEMDITLIEVN